MIFFVCRFFNVVGSTNLKLSVKVVQASYKGIFTGPVNSSFHTNGNFCHLLITFANSLDPDQA